MLGGDALAKRFEGYEPKYVNELVKNYGDMLYRICLCILCDKDDAEDAVQDTFLKFLTKAPQFESNEHEKAWLIKVATNISKNMLLLRIKHRTVDINELEYVGAAEEDKDEQLYDLNGRPVSSDYRGIVIKGKKKVLRR